MSAHVIIAVRGGPSAKSRFGERLTHDQREDLVEAMLVDMLAVLTKCPGVTRVHVTTPTPTLARLAAEHGVTVIHENARLGLNGAFSRARDQIAAAAPRAVIALLPGDLPLLDANEVTGVLTAAAEGAVVLVPASNDGGTGAVVAPASKPLPLAFGPGSFEKHQAAAETLNLNARVIAAPSLGFDIDRPEDIDTLIAAKSSGAAATLLKNIDTAGATPA